MSSIEACLGGLATCGGQSACLGLLGKLSGVSLKTCFGADGEGVVDLEMEM